MNTYHWDETFRALHKKAVEQYEAGNRQPESYFTEHERHWLNDQGCSAQEVYDFAEDYCSDQEPSFGTALLITAVRRDYFLWDQKGRPSDRTISMENLPPKEEKLGGHEWLPRIIEKARAKLRGEMPADLMYGCGGDRAFLSKVGVHPADFLNLIRRCGEDREAIVDYVQRHAQQRT